MKSVELTSEVIIGGKNIDAITVHPIGFLDFASVVKDARAVRGVKFESALQRQRIISQAHFMIGSDRVTPDQADILRIPSKIARAIIAELDSSLEVSEGDVLADGDGQVSPIHIRLGNPIKIKDGKGKTTEIAELEFMAEFYGDIEDVLAAPDEISKAMLLIEKIAAPVGFPMPRLPAAVLGQISLADGVMIMQKVAPLF